METPLGHSHDCHCSCLPSFRSQEGGRSQERRAHPRGQAATGSTTCGGVFRSEQETCQVSMCPNGRCIIGSTWVIAMRMERWACRAAAPLAPDAAPPVHPLCCWQRCLPVVRVGGCLSDRATHNSKHEQDSEENICVAEGYGGKPRMGFAWFYFFAGMGVTPAARAARRPQAHREGPRLVLRMFLTAVAPGTGRHARISSATFRSARQRPVAFRWTTTISA